MFGLRFTLTREDGPEPWPPLGRLRLSHDATNSTVAVEHIAEPAFGRFLDAIRASQRLSAKREGMRIDEFFSKLDRQAEVVSRAKAVPSQATASKNITSKINVTGRLQWDDELL